MGYACLYKAAAKKVNEIPAEEKGIAQGMEQGMQQVEEWLSESLVIA